MFRGSLKSRNSTICSAPLGRVNNVYVKKVIADLLLNLALKLGPERVTANVIKRSYAPAVADAIFTARPDWGADEARAVAAFLNSCAGRLFSKRIWSVAAHVAIEGANDRAHTIHSAGVSAGWIECVRYLHSLSRVSRDQDTSQPNDSQQPEDEAALVERLSP
jgi:hypothetical protein